MFQPGRRGRRSEQISEEALFALDMSGTYRCGFEALTKQNGRVTVRAVSSSLVVRDGATKVIARIMWKRGNRVRCRNVISNDLRFGEFGHALQLMYTFRVFPLTANQIRIAGLDAFLADLAKSENPAVAGEADALLRHFKAKPASKRERIPAEVEEERPQTRGKRVKVAEEPNDEIPLFPDSSRIEPVFSDSPRHVSVSVPITYWGIHYNNRECFLFAMGESFLFVLRGSGLRLSPSAEYLGHFLRERRLFESSSAVYRALQDPSEKGLDLNYGFVLNEVWNQNRNDDVLIVEEDLIMEFPVLRRELRALDRMKGESASVVTFEMNNFVHTLEFEYECWKKNASLPYNSMTTAEYRSNQLRTDAHVIEAIQNGTLPASSCAAFPAVTECAREELTCSDWL